MSDQITSLCKFSSGFLVALKILAPYCGLQDATWSVPCHSVGPHLPSPSCSLLAVFQKWPLFLLFPLPGMLLLSSSNEFFSHFIQSLVIHHHLSLLLLGCDGVTKTGLDLLLKTTRISDKNTGNQCFQILDNRQLSNYDPWGKRGKKPRWIYGCLSFLSGGNLQNMGKWERETKESPVTSMSWGDGGQSLGVPRGLEFCGQDSEKEGAKQEKSSKNLHGVLVHLCWALGHSYVEC